LKQVEKMSIEEYGSIAQMEKQKALKLKRKVSRKTSNTKKLAKKPRHVVKERNESNKIVDDLGTKYHEHNFISTPLEDKPGHIERTCQTCGQSSILEQF